MYYLGVDGKIYDDGLGDRDRPYALGPMGRRFSLEPGVAQQLLNRYYADHPPAPVGGVSAARVAEIRSRFPIGDVIARLTGAVGIQPCEPCKKRQQALNQFGDRVASRFR